MADQKVLSCNIKSPVAITVGDQKTEFHAGCSVIDVTFKNVFYVEVQEIHFKNFYTASLSILAKLKESAKEGTGGEGKWLVCVRSLQLMPHPHCDQGSEDYVTITANQFLVPLQNITELRFILRQPSPRWKDFKLESLKLYKKSPQERRPVALPAWLSQPISSAKHEDDDEKQLKGVPCLDELCQSLQSMWAVAQRVTDARPEVTLGRYDVDGSYEINLLSYN